MTDFFQKKKKKKVVPRCSASRLPVQSDAERVAGSSEAANVVSAQRVLGARGFPAAGPPPHSPKRCAPGPPARRKDKGSLGEPGAGGALVGFVFLLFNLSVAQVRRGVGHFNFLSHGVLQQFETQPPP